jgi:S-DNA-T family DNA segregation ATPase FtsK/SpoIIIE
MIEGAVRLFQPKERDFAEILKSFRIKFYDIEIQEDEYFDIYNIRLEPGSKLSALDRILPDLGLHLKAHSVPRGYPVFSEGVYRIEVQKSELATKTFEELYSSPDGFYAPVTLGVNSDGSPFIMDLHKLPNLLIGGVPGSGKSVLLHSIALSLIAAKAELYLVDPKMVEFNTYKDVSRVKMLVNTVDETYELIKEVNSIMQSRFETLQWASARNIHEYNETVRPQKKMTPIIIIIDEWADIVLQDSKIQKPLCVIAQKGRAAGVSIVLATQRPSRTVISGLIKANFSGRIALRVASSVDSRIILEQSGGEKIRNIGEGLYLDQRLSEPKMFKATYIENPQSTLEQVDDLKSSLPFWKRLWL